MNLKNTEIVSFNLCRCLIACCIVIGFLYAPSIMAQHKETIIAIDKMMQERYPANQPGAVVLVAKDGKVIFRKGYGKASLNPDANITPESVFRIGSLTKQFTAVAILQLVQAGKIDLRDDIRKYLPDYPTQDKKITIEHLLTHTSGIPNYTSMIELKAGEALSMSAADRINIFKTQPLNFAPGERFQYTNTGFFLLGAIIEKVTGQPYSDYLRDHIFTPLKMKSTYYNVAEIKKGKATVGYQRRQEGFYPADVIDSSMPFAAGALATNVDDFWKWQEGVFNYKLLPKSTIEKAWKSGRLANGMETGYGYGWSLARLDDIDVIDHGGQIQGYLSYALYLPEAKVFVVVLTNEWLSNAPGDAYDIARHIINRPVKAPEAIQLDPQLLTQFEGNYDAGTNSTYVVRREGNMLTIHWRPEEKAELIPYKQDQFAVKGTREYIKFFRDKNSNIIGISHAGDWVNETAIKTNQQLKVEKVAINLDGAKFDPFVGTYELAPNYKITVWREGTTFFGQATGSHAYEIFPESESKFFLKVGDAQVEFIKDAHGNVTGLILNMNGRSTPGKKVQ